LEQHLVEIGELRERLTKKEQEVNETLAEQDCAEFVGEGAAGRLEWDISFTFGDSL
jgi:hypothetical protein